MMNFNLTEEQEMLQKMTRNFVNKEIMPYIGEWDEKGYFDKGIMKRLVDLDLMGVCIPEEYGGSGMDYNSLEFHVTNGIDGTPYEVKISRTV